MKTLRDILERVREADRRELLYVRPAGAESFSSLSAREFVDRVERCAAGLFAAGAREGDRVGLICQNRPEWHVVDFACHLLGAVPVPLFPTLTGPEVAYCLGDSGSALLVVDSPEQLAKAATVASSLDGLHTLVVIDPPAELPRGAGPPRVVALADLLTEGVVAPPEPAADPDALATLIYTSGTTGAPKGVMLTHGNLVANVEALQQRNPATPDDIGLSLLPLCHAYERTVDYSYLAHGAAVAYSAPTEVSADFKLVRPTIMIGVPRLYEKLRDAIEARVAGSRPLDRRVYATALDAGMRRARARLAGEREDFLNRLVHPIVDFFVLSKIREVMGGRMRLLSAGGAALDAELNWWFAAVGWTLVQGYGLSETSPIIAANGSDDNRIGSVGRPLENVQVRIAEDGEVLTRGPHVMKGYWKRPDATAETIQDGWLRTGDIGRLDGDGYLYITDRKKSLLVTSTGKKVAPQPLENQILRSPWIEQVVVVGDDRRFVAALIVPAWDRLRVWASKRSLPTTLEFLHGSGEVRALIQSELDRLQADFARYERVRAFRLLEEPLSVESGHLTPTLKVIRRNVERDFADLIEDIYAE